MYCSYIILIISLLYIRIYILRKNNLNEHMTDIDLNHNMLNKISTCSRAIQQNDLVPKGLIIMWSGDINNIPTGWVICDGQNKTPDLRGRFIVSGKGHNPNNTNFHITPADYVMKYSNDLSITKGGLENVKLTEDTMPKHGHSHKHKAEHKHSLPIRWTNDKIDYNGYGGNDKWGFGSRPNIESSNFWTGAYKKCCVGESYLSAVQIYNKDNRNNKITGYDWRGGSPATYKMGGYGKNIKFDNIVNKPKFFSYKFTGHTTGGSDSNTGTNSSSNQGDTKSHSNIPSYWALAYIMKI